ncbi:MAG TPA: 50S ribosomal protein L10 [Candidatus Dormibacteraeota bacterium]|nr:50S ribosomal protein L10 [Candidatus Dormibacteraeota bacterium]
MALTKAKKDSVVSQISKYLIESKMTVLATYQGTSVKAMQSLRQQARTNGTHVQVVKNRLLIKALEGIDKFKDFDSSVLRGMLIYAFNSEDEVAPAQALAQFAKTQPSLQFVGAITDKGLFISSDDVKALASLPGKEQLRGILVGTMAAPLSSFINLMASNLRGVSNVLNARADIIA